MANGSVNVPGGTAKVEVDTTLSKSGAAADANATGEAIKELSENIEEYKKETEINVKPKAGLIYISPSSVLPDGFLWCDGAEYSRTEYPELFAAIGTQYGEGDGSTTFCVPNLSTRVPVGTGDGYELGDTGGEETHTLTVDEMPSHTHDVYTGCGSAADAGNIVQRGYSGDSYKSISGSAKSTGGSNPHNNMQPYTVVNYIIATGKDTGVSVQDIIAGAQALPLAIEYGGTGAANGADAQKNLLAAGPTVLSPYQYGDTLPEPGTPGRIFFLKVQ